MNKETTKESDARLDNKESTCLVRLSEQGLGDLCTQPVELAANKELSDKGPNKVSIEEVLKKYSTKPSKDL